MCRIRLNWKVAQESISTRWSDVVYLRSGMGKLPSQLRGLGYTAYTGPRYYSIISTWYSKWLACGSLVAVGVRLAVNCGRHAKPNLHINPITPRGTRSPRRGRNSNKLHLPPVSYHQGTKLRYWCFFRMEWPALSPSFPFLFSL